MKSLQLFCSNSNEILMDMYLQLGKLSDADVPKLFVKQNDELQVSEDMKKLLQSCHTAIEISKQSREQLTKIIEHYVEEQKRVHTILNCSADLFNQK